MVDTVGSFRRDNVLNFDNLHNLLLLFEKLLNSDNLHNIPLMFDNLLARKISENPHLRPVGVETIIRHILPI